MKTSQIIHRISIGIATFTLASFAMLSAVWWIRNYFAPYGAGRTGDYLHQLGVMGAIAIAFGCFFTGVAFYKEVEFTQEITAFRRQLVLIATVSVVLLIGMWAYLNTVPQWFSYKANMKLARAMHASDEFVRAKVLARPKGVFYPEERPITALLDMKRDREHEREDFLALWGDPMTREIYFKRYFIVVSDSQFVQLLRDPRSWLFTPMDKPGIIAESEEAKYRDRLQTHWEFMHPPDSALAAKRLHKYREASWGLPAMFYRAIGLTFLPSVMLVTGFAIGLFFRLRINPKYHRLAVLVSVLILVLVFVQKEYDPLVAFAYDSTKFKAYAPLVAEALLFVFAVMGLFAYSRKFRRLEKEAKTDRTD